MFNCLRPAADQYNHNRSHESGRGQNGRSGGRSQSRHSSHAGPGQRKPISDFLGACADCFKPADSDPYAPHIGPTRGRTTYYHGGY
jgi:hypothetical protein